MKTIIIVLLLILSSSIFSAEINVLIEVEPMIEVSTLIIDDTYFLLVKCNSNWNLYIDGNLSYSDGPGKYLIPIKNENFIITYSVE
ncbi:MAG: hypothetical protein ACOCRK_11995 [bacterium]